MISAATATTATMAATHPRIGEDERRALLVKPAASVQHPRHNCGSTRALATHCARTHCAHAMRTRAAPCGAA